MVKNPGYIVEYTKKNGELQKGFVYHEDQVGSFTNFKKVLIKLCNDDYTPKRDHEGRQLVTVMHQDEIKKIGYTD